jgi:hypothetical protein
VQIPLPIPVSLTIHAHILLCSPGILCPCPMLYIKSTASASAFVVVRHDYSRSQHSRNAKFSIHARVDNIFGDYFRCWSFGGLLLLDHPISSSIFLSLWPFATCPGYWSSYEGYTLSTGPFFIFCLPDHASTRSPQARYETAPITQYGQTRRL